MPSNNQDVNSDVSAWKLVVPAQLVPSLLRKAHNSPSSAHLGFAKTLEILSRQFYWTHMARDVRNYVQSCETCKQIKPTNYITQPEMGKYFEVQRPFQKIFVDFLGPYPRSKLGNTHILIVLDQYTKFVWLEPLRNATSHHVISFLKRRVFNVFGVPEYLVSDNGKQFQANIFSDFLQTYGVKQMFTPKYSPQSNASERVNRTIISAIRAYIQDDHKQWDLHLDEIGSALRNAVHNSTGFSPYFLAFGQHKVGHGSSYQLMRETGTLEDRQASAMDACTRLSLAQELILSHLKAAYHRNVARYNLRSKSRVFEPGQTVFAKNFVQSNAGINFSAKLASKFLKATVVRKIGNVAYELCGSDGKILGIYHAKDIR